MELFHDGIITLSQWARSHLSDVSLGLSAIALLLAAPYLTSWARRYVSPMNLVLRTCCFALLCVLVGLAMVYLPAQLRTALAQLNTMTLAPVLLVLLLLAAILADR